MKYLIVPSTIIVGLIIIFVVIDLKDFRYGNVQTIRGDSNEIQSIPPATSFMPEITPSSDATNIETEPAVETTNPVDPLFDDTTLMEELHRLIKTPFAEQESRTNQLNETWNNNEIKPDSVTYKINTVPAAKPVVTEDEAEYLNEKAIEVSKIWMRLKTHLQNGYKNVYSANFNRLIGVNLTTDQEISLREKGFDISEFNKRLLPASWSIDFSSIPAGAFFQKVNGGYQLSSTAESMCILAPRFDSMKSSFFFDAVIRNASDKLEGDIEVGIYSSGMLNKGYNSLKTLKIAPGKEENVQWEISVYDHYSNISPTISVKGDIVIECFNVYRLDHKDFTIVEGTIQERSMLPDPKTADYPDCRFTAHFVGNSIATGKTCKKELVLSFEGFLDKKILPTNVLKTNDKIKCAIVRFDSVPESISGIQEADNLNLFELESYLVTSFEIISSFSDYSETNLGVVFDDLKNKDQEYISIFDRKINSDMPAEVKQAQETAIKQDLHRINEMLLPYTDEKKNEINSQFLEVWEIEKKKDKQNFNRIEKFVWRNVDTSFYALPESYNIIEDYPTLSQENLNSLIVFKDYLESQGVQLIISIVPVNYDISARAINRDFLNLPDFRTAYLVKQLLENDIEAIYASDIILSKYNMYENPYYYPGDTHPGDLPQDVLSDIVAERLLRFKFERQFAEDAFKVVRCPNTYMWALLRDRSFPKDCDIGNHKPGDFYTFNRIYYQDKEIINETNSPILVLGNSFSNVPQPISWYLCMKSGIGIYHYSIPGTGILSTAFQRIFNSPEKFIKDRKVFVLHLGTTHLLANISIPNLRELDMGANIIENKNLIHKIEVFGNVSIIPEYATQLSNPSIFLTKTDGDCTIIDNVDLGELSSDASSDLYLVLTYCCEGYDNFELRVNGVAYPLTGADHSYMWLKKVISIPQGTKTLNIEVKGKSNSYFAIGDILLYQ